MPIIPKPVVAVKAGLKSGVFNPVTAPDKGEFNFAEMDLKDRVKLFYVILWGEEPK